MSDQLTLQRTLEEWRARSGAPGVAATVRVDGRLHWSSANLSTTIFPETRLGRVAIAVFVNTSAGPASTGG